jgi:H/ACA ribonucleoprotein complex subunit 2
MTKEKVDKTEKKKKRKEQAENAQPAETSALDPRELCSVIAKPMADTKMLKKLLKLTKKAAKRKQLKLGVKEVLKAVRKDAKG